MNRGDLYVWNFCKLINNKLHKNFEDIDYVYSNDLNELETKYSEFFEEYKSDGLLHPCCYADRDRHELSLINHNANRDYDNIPVYYAVLENNPDREDTVNNIIVDKGLAYRSKHYSAGMGTSLYGSFRTYWRCIPDDKNIKPYQCCLLHKSIYDWEPKICAGKPESLYKIYDHDYTVEHCTEFSPNYNYGEFFRNRLIVISTEKDLLDQYIEFHKGKCKSYLQKLIDKYKEFIMKI